MNNEAGARYVAGNCVDCGEKPYSAGRIRCETCHLDYVERMNKGEI